MENQNKPSNLADKIIKSDKAVLPEVCSVKITCTTTEPNIVDHKSKPNVELTIEKLVESKDNKIQIVKDIIQQTQEDPTKIKEEELSAKEQESRKKFKEKLNKLKKIPMPPQPTINVNSEGLTEGELTIENIKKKFKEFFAKSLPENIPQDLTKKKITDEKKNIVNIGTKPMSSDICKYACINSCKNNNTVKEFESVIFQSINLLPDEFVNEEQIELIIKEKQKLFNFGNTYTPIEPNIVSKSNASDTATKPIDPNIEVKLIDNHTLAKANSATNDVTKSDFKSEEILNKEKVCSSVPKDHNDLLNARLKIPEENKLANNKNGIFLDVLKHFTVDYKNSKFLNMKHWFSVKNPDVTKMKKIPKFTFSKLPLRWRQGFVLVGTFIPLYYSYYKMCRQHGHPESFS